MSSWISIITTALPLPPPGVQPYRYGLLTLGDPPPGAPPCERCGEPAALIIGARNVRTYCAACTVELVDHGLNLSRS